MAYANQALVLDLVEWVASKPRTYEETMAAWRTSCPRLTIWEDAVDHELVAAEPNHNGGEVQVRATKAGLELLAQEGRI